MADVMHISRDLIDLPYNPRSRIIRHVVLSLKPQIFSQNLLKNLLQFLSHSPHILSMAAFPPSSTFPSPNIYYRNPPKPIKKIAPSSAHKDIHPWSPEEDEALTSATRTYGLNWDLACEVLLSNPSLPSRKFMRTPTACAERYRTVLQPRAAGEEKGAEKEPPSPSPAPQPQAGQAHFGILDVIRNMVNQKKDIPGMIGSAAQTDQSVPPHASHLQVGEFDIFVLATIYYFIYFINFMLRLQCMLGLRRTNRSLRVR